MKISDKIKKALVDQIAMEGYASNYYLSMGSWCKITGYDGASSLFHAQSDEERQHMLKIINFLNDIGVSTPIPQIKQPPSKFRTLEEICKTALKNEQAVTASIDKIVELALKEKNHAIHAFLQWFVNEQVQEETKFEAVLQKFNLIGRDKLALVEIDKALGVMATVPDEPAA
jgi:ferritin